MYCDLRIGCQDVSFQCETMHDSTHPENDFEFYPTPIDSISSTASALLVALRDRIQGNISFANALSSIDSDAGMAIIEATITSMIEDVAAQLGNQMGASAQEELDVSVSLVLWMPVCIQEEFTYDDGYYDCDERWEREALGGSDFEVRVIV